jgi:D-sedoheptulose 7-phosphate isomerase
MKAYIKQEIAKGKELLARLLADDPLVAELEKVAHCCVAAIRSGGKVLFAGNGGSAADAQHLAAEFVCRFAFDRAGLPAFSLVTDSSVMTAIGNDYGFEHLFARQIQAVGVAGDVFVGISTSGHSPNILLALAEARRKGLVAVGFTGESGGKMLDHCDLCIRIPSQDTPRIQEGHIVLGHILCGIVEQTLFPLRTEASHAD